MQLIAQIKKVGIVVLLSPFFSLAQPSGDAGIGRFGAFGSEVLPLTKKQPLQVSLGSFYSTGRNQVSYLSPYTRFAFRVSSDAQVSLELAANAISQPFFGDFFAVGDALLAFQYFIPTRVTADFVINLGLRLPTGNGNHTRFLEKDQPLFMQPSLGSLDFLAGFSFAYNGLTTGLALQIPLQATANRYLPNVSGDDNLRPVFPATRYLSRGADLALFAKKDIRISKVFWAHVGTTPILRLQRSSFLNAGDEMEEVLGTNGLTLNVFGGVTHAVKQWLFTLEGGVPLVQMDQQLDGLHRYLFAGIRVTRQIGPKKPKPKAEE